MNVAYHSSDSFALVLGTSLASLFENNKGVDTIHVYIIEENITDINKNRLRELAMAYHRDIHFIPMPDINKEQRLGLKKVRSDWIFNSYCRLFLDKLLPSSIHKVLYLDSDVLITGDLTQLWNTDMTGYCAASVKDCLGLSYYELFGLSADANYCNSGVILQNIDLWRKANIAEKVRDYVHEKDGYVFFMEQSVYNVIFQGQIKILPPEYNTYTIMQCLTYDEMVKLRRPINYYSREEIAQAVRKPVIVHLTGSFLITNRAWFVLSNHPEKERFEYYKRLTPWKDEQLFPDKRTPQKKVFQSFINYLPKSFVVTLVGYIYSTLRIYNIKRLRKKYRKDMAVQ